MITSNEKVSFCSSYSASFKNIEAIKIKEWEDIKRCIYDVLEEFNDVNEAIMSEEIDVTTFND